MREKFLKKKSKYLGKIENTKRGQKRRDPGLEGETSKARRARGNKKL